MPVPKSKAKKNLKAEVARYIPSCRRAVDRMITDHLEGNVTRVYYSDLFGSSGVIVETVVREAIIVEITKIYSKLKWKVVDYPNSDRVETSFIAFS